MKAQEKTVTQQRANHSSAHTVSTNALQKKAVGVVQKVEPEEEIQQQKSDKTVQKMDAPELDEEHPEGVMQPKTQAQAQTEVAPVQLKENKTGMPDNLKSGIENLSGMSMDHVKVHYNSSQPAQLNALAYAQGSDIHIGPGQEKHLPHEAWHVVQQAQGRVQATTQMKGAVPVNDDPGLEHEADVMGEKALNAGHQPVQKKNAMSVVAGPYQLRSDKRVEDGAREHYDDIWGTLSKIKNDEALIAKVPDSVRGSGEILLLYGVTKKWTYRGDQYRNIKKCNILYEDKTSGWGNHSKKYTSIYHCGPTGGTIQQYLNGSDWINT